MSNLNVKTDYSDLSYTELTSDSFLIRIKPNESTVFLNEIVSKLNIAFGFDILDNVDTSAMVTYRKDVSIDSAAIKAVEEYVDFFREEKDVKVLDLANFLLEEVIRDGELPIDGGDFLQEWGIFEETAEEVHYKEAFKIFLRNKGVDYALTKSGITPKHKFNVEDIIRYLNYLSNDKRLKLFKILRSRLNSNNNLPINYATKDFIKVKKGKSLVSITVDDEPDSSHLLSLLISKINQTDVEFVNFAKERGRIHLNILCNNDDANRVVEVLVHLYDDLWSNTGLEKRSDFYVNVEVEKNLSHEGYEQTIYCIVQGSKFETIREDLTEINIENDGVFIDSVIGII
ncbi:hypothetical protein P9X10_02680 [Bacillus cereus]|nr:hypothetical protein [Bacillus cereus]